MNGRRLTVLLAALAALPLVYLGAYFAVAQRGTFFHYSGGVVSWSVDYSPLPTDTHFLFESIHGIDRNWLRPDYWEEDVGLIRVVDEDLELAP